MTDNDIIKALEHCTSSTTSEACNGCPLFSTTIFTEMENGLQIYALDLINRLKAEIEWLTGYNENLQTANTALSNEILDIRNATIKEFEEKLKSHKRRMCGNDNGGLYWDQAVLVDDIDRVMKEMTEDQE